MPLITELHGPWRALSNFSLYPVDIDGITYPTSEHAYQAHKTTDRVLRGRIAARPTPGQAKRAGRDLKLRVDWSPDLSVALMRMILLLKFTQNPEALTVLRKSDGLVIEEGNSWGDSFWGVDASTRIGENWLGRLLQSIRGTLS